MGDPEATALGRRQKVCVPGLAHRPPGAQRPPASSRDLGPHTALFQAS